MAMDFGRILFSKVGLRDAAHQCYYLPWSPADLEDLGSDEGLRYSSGWRFDAGIGQRISVHGMV